MKRYTRKKKTIIGKIRELKTRKKELQQMLQDMKNEGKEKPWTLRQAEVFAQLVEEAIKIDKKISKLKKQIAIRATAIVGAIGIVAGGRAAYTDINNDRQDNVLESSYSMVEGNYQKNAQGDPNNEQYKQFEYYLRQYLELANKKSRSPEEDKQMEAYRILINSSPEELSNYTLKVLKKKIAEAIGIDDYSRIEIDDKSGIVSADEWHSANGFQEDITICIDGKPFLARKAFRGYSDGEEQTEEDSMPKELVEVIEAITTADEPKGKIKALRAVLELKKETIVYLTEDGSEIPEDLEH